MNKLTYETIRTIRALWTQYYETQQELEVQHALLHKFEVNVYDFDSMRKISNFVSMEEYLEQSLSQYKMLVEELYSYKRKISVLERIYENASASLEKLLKENGLQQEDRSYDRDLYNLVNGLE